MYLLIIIFKAVSPLLLSNSGLRDSVILVLRKAMFSREADAKEVAVEGFSILLSSFKV